MNSVSVDIELIGSTDIYEPRYISFGNNCIIGCDNSRNMGLLLGYCSEEDSILRKRPIQAQMNQYNKAVQNLWSIPGFKEYFAECHSYLPITLISEKFGEEVADVAGQICHVTNCDPDLQLIHNALQLRGGEFIASFQIEGKTYSFDVKTATADAFIQNNMICFLDWTDDGCDRLYGMLSQLINDEVISGDAVDYVSTVVGYEFLDGITNPRHNAAMEYTIRILRSRGYLNQYSLQASNYPEVWNYSTSRKDNTVLFMTLDPAYKKDKLLCERLNCLWNALYVIDENAGWEESAFDPNVPFYFLQDNENKTYISRSKAKLGGHNKLKIYGRLDCPSAKRYLAKGQYVQHRVFFTDEETAIAAGYRPCGVCMKEAYKKWKADQQEKQ